MKKAKRKIICKKRKPLRKHVAIVMTSVLVLILSPFTVSATTINVYAASSMTNVINEIGDEFKKETGNKVVAIYGGSSTLARQIEQGAPADIFISANPKWIEYLTTQSVISENKTIDLVSNTLVLIKADSVDLDEQISQSLDNNTLAQLPALLGNQHLAIGEPSSVPAGMYAKESLESLGLWKMLDGKIAPSSNVRLTLALVERGQAPLGIVYKTDALLSTKVTMLSSLPESSHSRIIYPATPLNDKATSLEFMMFLNAKFATKAFEKYGFSPVK